MKGENILRENTDRVKLRISTTDRLCPPHYVGLDTGQDNKVPLPQSTLREKKYMFVVKD